MMCHFLSITLSGRLLGQARFGLLSSSSFTNLRSHVMSSNVHRTAEEGFKQGDHYDQSRPSYTDNLVSQVLQNMSKEKFKGLTYDIVELGAGTGKFTTQILPLLAEDTRYLATEPSEDFLSVLKSKLKVDTQVCTSTSIPLKDNSVQNMICGQSFHWFANNESLQEIYRVLVPGGRLILVWNDKDYNGVGWLKKMEEVLTLYYDDTPRKILGHWKNVFDGNSMFKCVEHTQRPGIQLMGNKEFVLDHFTSISVIAKLSGEEKQQAIAKFRAVLDEKFKDEEDITINFISDFYCTEKI